MNLDTQKIYEHDIPDGSKLYFGASAKLKREIEAKAAEISSSSSSSGGGFGGRMNLARLSLHILAIISVKA